MVSDDKVNKSQHAAANTSMWALMITPCNNNFGLGLKFHPLQSVMLDY